MERSRRIRIGRLTTVGQVAAGTWTAVQAGSDVAIADASRLATILAAMRQCLEASELERRDCRDGGCSSSDNASQLVVQFGWSNEPYHPAGKLEAECKAAIRLDEP